MDTALVVAGISGAVALVSASYSRRAQLDLTELIAARDRAAKEEERQHERETREAERRSAAKIALDRYRGPLLYAAWQLGDRLDNIRHRDLLLYAADGSGRETTTKLTTVFRVAQYFGWRELLQREVQLLRFDREEDTRLVAALIDDTIATLATASLDLAGVILWAEEQRAIGELMLLDQGVLGYATFAKRYENTFEEWMETACEDLLSPAAPSSDRIRVLQWALFGLVTRLDEEGVYDDSGWLARAAKECTLRSETPHSRVEARIRGHLDTLDR